MMSLRSASVLLLPIITGLTGVVWAEAVARSGAGPATACAAIAYVIVTLGALAFGGASAGTIDLTGLVALVILNVLTGALWLVPLAGGTRYVSLALIEGAWPVFSIAFAWLLYGRRELDLTSAIGGVLILLGSALVFHKA